MKKCEKWNALVVCTFGLIGIAHAAVSEKYTYDASGNIIRKSIDGVVTEMSYDDSNKLVSLATGQAKETYSYDAGGRTNEVVSNSGKTVKSLTHGYSDKVIEASSAQGRVTFYYNAEGQLVGKKGTGSAVTYTWSNDALAAIADETFVNESHISGGVPVLNSKGEVVVSDHLGNTLVAGNEKFTSTAYGSGLEGARFTGKAYVEELASFLFPNRLYSSQSVHWNVADPSGFPDRENNLAYVNGDPFTTSDPTGLVDYVWDPTSTYAGHGQFTPKSITVKTAGTVKTVEVDKGNGKKCYQPVVDKAFEFKGGGHIEVPATDWVDGDGYKCDATFVTTTTQHETWHKTHRQTLGDKTYGVLETWSASYSGNQFKTAAAALSAGNSDFSAATAKAATEYASNNGKSGSHQGASPTTGYYPTTVGGVNVNRSQNPDWGGPLDAILGAITLTFDKVKGTCEY